MHRMVARRQRLAVPLMAAGSVVVGYANSTEVAHVGDCQCNSGTCICARVYSSRGRASWYLAAAANAYRLGDMATAAEYMGSAVAWDDDLSKEGQAMSLLLAEQYDFQNAIRAFKLTLGGKPPRSVDGLNQLAYYRALAGIELDEALADVDRAIELEGPNPLILDTKAWVLHELGRNLEALSFSNEAIKTLEVQLRNWGALDGATDEKSSADTAGAEVQNQDRQSNSGNDAIDDEAIDNEAVDNEAAELTSLWPDPVDVREPHRISQTKAVSGCL